MKTITGWAVSNNKDQIYGEQLQGYDGTIKCYSIFTKRDDAVKFCNRQCSRIFKVKIQPISIKQKKKK